MSPNLSPGSVDVWPRRSARGGRAGISRKPRQPTPQPDPPSVAQAARITNAAWAQDESWGTLVWLVMVTGMRRAELLALRWSDVDLDAGMLTVPRNYVRANRQSIEKDTKTHQMRRLALDPATVDVLTLPGRVAEQPGWLDAVATGCVSPASRSGPSIRRQ